MNTKHFTKPFQIAIVAGALAALSAVTPARAFDQNAWLQAQLAVSDGGSYSSSAPGEKSASAYRADAQSAWLQGQLAISDGSAPFDVSNATQTHAVAPHPSDALANKRFAYVERGLHQSDGCNE
ncbi:MAG: hypothetical protein MUF80_09520 [Burkholderiales bacterium]|jgi:hypothetical protein|nr:hypothetical protein [Burkholderiales bacterium]